MARFPSCGCSFANTVSCGETFGDTSCGITVGGKYEGSMKDIDYYKDLLQDFFADRMSELLRKPSGILKHPYIVAGSSFYSTMLWDWDSWFANIALRQLAVRNDWLEESLPKYEIGCIRNFADHTLPNGFMPIVLEKDGAYSFATPKGDEWINMHKPVIAQHCAFVLAQNPKMTLPREVMDTLLRFIDAYYAHFYHKETGLFFWQDDCAIGVDNDPCTYYRPKKSSGSILLNSFMYRELQALASIYERDGEMKSALELKRKAECLGAAVNRHCFDERDGSYYSVDLALLPVDPAQNLHSGGPRTWDSLIMRWDVWSNILPLWAGIAGQDEARGTYERIIDPSTFWAPYGVRTLSRKEKMYNLAATNNPSNWLGPVWGVSNYLSFRALCKYGFEEKAEELAEKTILLFGRDVERTGTTHEYYNPDTGEAIMTPDFINWNALVLNMIAWLNGGRVIEEF